MLEARISIFQIIIFRVQAYIFGQWIYMLRSCEPTWSTWTRFVLKDLPWSTWASGEGLHIGRGCFFQIGSTPNLPNYPLRYGVLGVVLGSSHPSESKVVWKPQKNRKTARPKKKRPLRLLGLWDCHGGSVRKARGNWTYWREMPMVSRFMSIYWFCTQKTVLVPICSNNINNPSKMTTFSSAFPIHKTHQLGSLFEGKVS